MFDLLAVRGPVGILLVMELIRRYARQVRDVPGNNLTAWEHEYVAALLSIANVLHEVSVAVALDALVLNMNLTKQGSAANRAARKAHELLDDSR